MKLTPTHLTTPKQVRVYQTASTVMSQIDKCEQATRKADNTPSDHDPLRGEVAVSDMLVERTPMFPDVPMDQAADELKIRSAVLQASGSFNALVSLPGAWGVLPVGIEANVSKVSHGDQTVYDQKLKGTVAGPNHCKVTLDKKTGEVDYREYWLGFIRKPV